MVKAKAKSIRRKSRDQNAHKHKPRKDSERGKEQNRQSDEVKEKQKSADKGDNGKNRRRRNPDNKPSQPAMDKPVNQQDKGDKSKDKGDKARDKSDKPKDKKYNKPKHRRPNSMKKDGTVNAKPQMTTPARQERAKTEKKDASGISGLLKKPMKWLKSLTKK